MLKSSFCPCKRISALNIQIMILCMFLGREKWGSENGKIILEIRRIFKILINGVNIIPVRKNGKIRFLNILFLHKKKRVWFCTTKKGERSYFPYTNIEHIITFSQLLRSRKLLRFIALGISNKFSEQKRITSIAIALVRIAIAIWRATEKRSHKSSKPMEKFKKKS